MVPSASHPDLSVVMEAPLEIPSLGERRWRCQLPYPRWVWLALTMILTLAITLTVLYYVGALSGNRPPSSPPVQYKQPREPRPPPADRRTQQKDAPTDSPTSTSVAAESGPGDDLCADDDDPTNSDGDHNIAFVLDIDSPMDRPSTPRSQNGSPNLSSRNGKRGVLPSAILHFRLDLGLFDAVNFSDLPIESSFCVVTSRSFTPDFQQLIPKIDVEFASGHMLTIYTTHDRLHHHPCAKRLYFSLKGDECPQSVKADVWALLDEFGPDLRRIIAFVRPCGFLSEHLQGLFLDDFPAVFPDLLLIDRSNIAGDLIFVSAPDMEPWRMQIPERPFFRHVDLLIEKQRGLVALLNEAWHRFIELWATVFELPEPDDRQTLDNDVVKMLRKLSEVRYSAIHQILPELRAVFEKTQLSLEEMRNSIDMTDRQVRRFAMEIGEPFRNEDLVQILKVADPGTIRFQAIAFVNELHSIKTVERFRFERLEWLKVLLTEAGVPTS